MNASRYLVERGKKVKGHPLCWHTDENGFAEMAGYKGDYALSGASGSGSFRLTKAQDATEVQCTTGARPPWCKVI